jgi:hypothetical protein
MASEFSETQRQILTTAAQRKSGVVLPVTSKLKGGALKKVSALLGGHVGWRIPAAVGVASGPATISAP